MKLSLILVVVDFAFVASHSLTSITVEKSVLTVESDSELSWPLAKYFSFLKPKSTFKLSLEEEEAIASEYFEKFNKNVDRSDSEIDFRKKILLKRFYEVREHNEKFARGETLFKQELNKFSDYSHDELRGMLQKNVKNMKLWPKLNGTVPPPPSDRIGNLAAPNEWDWEKYTVVQDVQDQGQCGSCYAFAALAAIEGSMCRYHGECTKLSEQEAMECTRGCNGGWDDLVYGYTKNLDGAAYAKNYGYQGHVASSCSAHGSRVPHSKVTNSKDLPNNSEEQKKFLYDYGPLYVGFDVFSSFYGYGGGIYSDCKGAVEGGHAVLVVGYGEQNGVPYWIVKNSWGKGWGTNGFFKIVRGRDCATIESSSVSFPFTS